MTWRSDTCFSRFAAGLLLLLTVRSGSSAATIAGSVRLVESADSAVRKNSNYSGVVVWLEGGQPLVRAARKHAEMIQKGKRFSPHVLAISTGTVVDFPNLDPIFHNAFSNFDGKVFDVALYPPGSSRSVRFDRSGIVRVFCNIHPSMSAIIVVVNSPNFTITGPDGKFAIPNVAPGTYRLRIFHERATPEVLEKLSRTINVDESSLDLPLVQISEAGYLPVPHKNKYGRDYPHGDAEDTYSPLPQ
jgi:plastocyanin